MAKKVVVISTSLRANSNSDKLAQEFAEGAKQAGHEVEYISLRGKKIAFCLGCLACQTKGECVIKDDALPIAEAVLHADVVAWATPIYYYEMSGQMKVLIDRMNSMYPTAIKVSVAKGIGYAVNTVNAAGCDFIDNVTKLF